ncbi:MAG: transposase [Candidatus Bathyarchaeia archaeon]
MFTKVSLCSKKEYKPFGLFAATKAIASARIKSDKVDARILANLLRVNLIAESYVPSKPLREVRTLVRHRASIVKIGTMIKNKAHALIDKHGFKYEHLDLSSH